MRKTNEKETIIENTCKTASRSFTCALAAGLVVVSVISAPMNVHAVSNEAYYYSEFQKKDSGYEKTQEKKANDLHAGWELGRFCVRGFSDVRTSGDDIIFLKEVGDEISLSFLLEQDIDSINGDSKLSIADDKDGYDTRFDIARGRKDIDFGRGTLLVKHTNYQNNTDYVPYVDYLTGVSKGAETSVELFEEGDYEVALDYEVVKDGLAFMNSHANYQILFRFSVRDGECPVDLMDLKTGSDMLDGAYTENGFVLELSGSQYLKAYVKRFVLSESGDDLVAMGGSMAHDGDTFKDEGVYDITVSNIYTGQEALKRVYVGTDPVLRAHLDTGVSLEDVRKVYEYFQRHQ